MPASIVAGSSVSGSSAWPLTARLSPTSMALSPSVAARHSRMPVSSERSAAGDDPVPGLLNERNVVVPPNAAATESWKKRSGSASEATRVWVWTSTTPGSTSQSGRVDHLGRTGRGPAQVRLDRFDDAAADRHVGPTRPVRRDDGAATDDEVGHRAAGGGPPSAAVAATTAVAATRRHHRQPPPAVMAVPAVVCRVHARHRPA